MRSYLHGLVMCASSLLLAAPAFANGDGNCDKGEADLVRPIPAPDPDAEGEIHVQHSTTADIVRFKAEHLDPSSAFDVFMETAAGSGNFVLFGAMTPDGDDGENGDDGNEGGDANDDDSNSEDGGGGTPSGDFALLVSSGDGPLPLGATSVDDYADRKVEVRTGATAVLVGMMPPAQSSQQNHGTDKAKHVLHRPPTGADPNAKGRVEISNKAKDHHQRFRIKGLHLAKGGTFTVVIEDEKGSNQFETVGTMKHTLGNGAFKLALDTNKGEPMPCGALDVNDLAGRKILVRDKDGNIVLHGSVPHFASSDSGDDENDDDQGDDQNEDDGGDDSNSGGDDGGGDD